ncbi:MAG: leucine/isoleucine/valine transporter permease subunit [Chloroflexi bacterium]|nr:MAG: leucine/isoleucine/valine transporter permease subunit [Chloroflexota bacterium]MBL1196339.1 leucine/isoleucine/valine transporter permease subunit [Chloroflexota bacterium]NOH13634.1 leucine/isoleucine/valine transporter permease subunit [Chloroflexota bacterium]
MEEKTYTWRDLINYGLLGSVVTLYFGMIGMLELFDERILITPFLSLGDVLLFSGVIGIVFFAVNKFASSLNEAFKVGAVVGAVSAIFPIVLSFIATSELIAEQFVIRDVFVSVTDRLVEIYNFGLEPIVGSLVLIVAFAIVGVLTALFIKTDPKIERPLLMGIVLTLGIGLFSENVTQILGNLPAGIGRSISRLLFTNKALTIVSALIIFLLTAGITYWRMRRPTTGESRGFNFSFEDISNRGLNRAQMIQLAIVAVVLLLLPWMVGSFLSQVLFNVGLFILMGLGLNIVVGYAGLLDLGYVAFFAFGAYTMGILTTATSLNPGLGLNFWTALPFAILIAVMFGIILGVPVLNMRGDYLAIVTLGFGEIIRILALSDWLAPVMGGAQGVLKIAKPVFFGVEMGSPETMYYMVLAGSLLVGFVAIRLRDSRLGRQWMAMREDEDVAEAMGINLVQTKLMAFAIGAAFSGLAGAIFSARVNNIFPHSFNLLISINALSLIIVGGIGSIPGVIIGALVLVGLPELLREFSEYRLLMYGILLIVMMLVRPEGFIPAEIYKRELRADEETETEIEAQVTSS